MRPKKWFNLSSRSSKLPPPISLDVPTAAATSSVAESASNSGGSSRFARVPPLTSNGITKSWMAKRRFSWFRLGRSKRPEVTAITQLSMQLAQHGNQVMAMSTISEEQNSADRRISEATVDSLASIDNLAGCGGTVDSLSTDVLCAHVKKLSVNVGTEELPSVALDAKAASEAEIAQIKLIKRVADGTQYLPPQFKMLYSFKSVIHRNSRGFTCIFAKNFAPSTRRSTRSHNADIESKALVKFWHRQHLAPTSEWPTRADGTAIPPPVKKYMEDKSTGMPECTEYFVDDDLIMIVTGLTCQDKKPINWDQFFAL